MRFDLMRLANALLLTAFCSCDYPVEADAAPVNQDDSDNQSTDTQSASASDDAGTASAASSAFCSEYGKTCGWTGAGRFTSKAACLSFEQAAGDPVLECTAKHLALAAGDADTHCPHAAGQGPCEETAAFCTAYEGSCGFDAAGFADASACSDALGKMSDEQKACAETHVELAEADPTTHCPHARGAGPCAMGDMPTSSEPDFCGDYGTTCSFGGAARFASEAECNAARAAMGDAEKQCTTDHLALASSDPTTHCPHATGAGPCDPASFFCAHYETACTFGGQGHFTSADDCRREYEAFSPITRVCAEEHVVLAEADPITHCPHAQGEGPCAGAQAFCSLYTTRCGYGGSERFADLADCQASIDEFSSERLSCVEEHLVLAGGDASLHCPHATGLGPCSAAP